MNSHRNSLLVEILLVVAVITALGALGFYFFEKPINKDLSIWDSFWWAMVTITTIGYGDIFPKTVGGRLIAIFLMFAGIGTLGISTAAIAAYFVKNDQLQLLRLRRIKGHVVICGLGEKGLLLSKAFRERGQAVVVIEQSENNDLIPLCREQGTIVLVGNARERDVLSLAHVQDARFLIAVCGDDGSNAEVAAHARELVRDRTGSVLTCSTHIVDPELWYLLRKWEVAMAGSFRLQFFNVFDIGARALLDAYPPFEEEADQAAASQAPAPHLLVVGGGRLGQSLVVHAARAWRDRLLARQGRETPAAEDRLKVTLIDRDTARIKEFLHLRHPELEKVCRIDAHPLDVTSPDFHRAAFLFDEDGHCDVSKVYVCVDDDALGLSAALALQHRIRKEGVPIIVRMTQDSGMATLLHGIGQSDQHFGSLRVVGLLERTCRPDLVLGGTNEILARSLHDKYVSDQKHQGQTSRSNLLLVGWDELPEEVHESNRSQAHHVGEKLKAIGCDIVPLTDWDAASFTFTPAEVELMAEMEHERWMAERTAQGWTYGPRDLQKKTNPSLLSWDRLPEETREFNRSAVREVPTSLSRAGFQIYRLG